MRKTEEIKQLLQKIVETSHADGILLSGGLDTSLVGFLARGKKLSAITVAVGENSLDLHYASILAKKFQWKHTVLKVSFEDLLRRMPETIRVLKTYDPMTLRNNVVIQMALSKAKKLGLKCVLTGDGGDELFAGYRFIFEKTPRAMMYSLRRMWEIMHFSSQDIGQALKIKVESPFLAVPVNRFAGKLQAKDFVTKYRGIKIGKAILRRAFESDLPEKFIWRVKAPIQDGSGAVGITQYLGRKTSDAAFKMETERIFKDANIRLRDKEQLAYFKMYQKIFGKPSRAGKGKTSCPDCHAEIVPVRGKYCRTCGLWPAC